MSFKDLLAESKRKCRSHLTLSRVRHVVITDCGKLKLNGAVTFMPNFVKSVN
jgi:hypothetical protein